MRSNLLGERDVAALIADIGQEGLPNVKHIGILPPCIGSLDGTQADLHTLCDIGVGQRLASSGVVVAGDIGHRHNRLTLMLHQQVLILEVDDPLAVRALNVHLAVVKALGLQILLLDDLAARQETAFNPSLCKCLKGVRAILAHLRSS